MRLLRAIAAALALSACTTVAGPQSSAPEGTAPTTSVSASRVATASGSPTPSASRPSSEPEPSAEQRSGDGRSNGPGRQRRLDEELLAAAYANRVARAARLMAAGADVNRADATGQSAFLIATSEVGDDPRLLDLALEHGADLRAKDRFNGTGLIRAAERGFPRIVHRLLAEGIEIDHVNNLGWTALHEAIVLGNGGTAHTAVVRLLVEAGADVSLPSQRDGARPRDLARQRGFSRIARILRAAERSTTPDARLLRAAAAGSEVAVSAALADGADIEARDDRGRTALLLAAAADRVAVARDLVARGADVNAVDDRRDTPFLVTGVTGSVAMLSALLPGRPDTTLTNRFGGVAVIPAAERGHARYVDAVLRRTDIDVDHVNDLGWTALLEAVILGDGGRRHQRVVASLLRHGANPDIADPDGLTALDHARQRGQLRIAGLLEAADR